MDSTSRKSDKKKENYIKSIYLKKSGDIKVFIQNLKTLKESDLISDSERSLMSVFQSWLLEIIQYGLFLAFIWNMFINNESIVRNLLLILALGTTRWLLFDTIKNIKKVTSE